MNGRFIDSIQLKREIGRGSYLREIPAVQFLMRNHTVVFDSDVTFFVGENGTGKSTLLEAIAVAFGFNAEGGTKNFSFSTNQTHSELCDCLTISRSKFARDGFFFVQKVFITLLQTLRRWTKSLPLHRL